MGLTLVNAQWLIEQMGLPNVTFAPTRLPTISEMVGMAAQATVTAFATSVSSSTRQATWKAAIVAGGENADDYARGARQWTAPWGSHGGNDFINMFPHGQYFRKYGGKHDDLAPFVVNQHRNGLLTPWGYNATGNNYAMARRAKAPDDPASSGRTRRALKQFRRQPVSASGHSG